MFVKLEDFASHLLKVTLKNCYLENIKSRFVKSQFNCASYKFNYHT